MKSLTPIRLAVMEKLSTRQGVVWAVAGAVFVGSFLVRFLELTFHNDHFEYLSLGAEILEGALPGIDFFDPTRPLQYYLSASLLWLFGHQLLAEAVLCVALLSLAATVVFFLGLEVSGAIPLGVLAGTFVVAALPRLYAYPKIIVPAVGLLVCWRYLDRASPARFVALCVATAASFYLRLDYGVWLGCAAMAGAIAGYWNQWRVLATFTMRYAAAVILLCGPYVVMQFALGGGITSGPGTGRLAHLLSGEDLISLGLPRVPSERPLVWLRPPGPLATVGWQPGITEESRSALEREYSLHRVQVVGDHAWQYVLEDRAPETLRRLISDQAVSGVTNIDDEGRILRDPPWSVLRRWLHVPVIESPFLDRDNAALWFYDALFVTPLLAAALLATGVVRRRISREELPKLLAAIVLAVLFNLFLIRGNLDSHLPDVIVPAAVLWAWMLRGSAREIKSLGGLTRFAVATGALISVWLAIDIYSGSMNHLMASELFSTPRRVAQRFKATIDDLRQDPLERFAPPGSSGLRGLIRYLNRCTKPSDHLLVLGYQPEVFFHADRRVGGGNVVFQANLGAEPHQQATIVTRLQRESVPIVILPVNRLDEIERSYPIVKDYVDRRYELAQESGFGEGRPIRVLIDRHAVPSHLDQELGLPCFSGSLAAARTKP
jgi:hypothetical protein